MRIRWTTTFTVLIGVLWLAIGVAGRPVHAGQGARASHPAAASHVNHASHASHVTRPGPGPVMAVSVTAVSVTAARSAG
jgi:hypothetical protein